MPALAQPGGHHQAEAGDEQVDRIVEVVRQGTHIGKLLAEPPVGELPGRKGVDQGQHAAAGDQGEHHQANLAEAQAEAVETLRLSGEDQAPGRATGVGGIEAEQQGGVGDQGAGPAPDQQAPMLQGAVHGAVGDAESPDRADHHVVEQDCRHKQGGAVEACPGAGAETLGHLGTHQGHQGGHQQQLGGVERGKTVHGRRLSSRAARVARREKRGCRLACCTACCRPAAKPAGLKGSRRACAAATMLARAAGL